MKKLNHLMLAAAAAVTFTAALSVQANEPFYAPRQKELMDSLRTVPGTTPDMIDRSIPNGSPKGRQQAARLVRVRSTGPAIDLAHAPRPLMAPKDPRYEVALYQNAEREFAEQEFQVAPLK